MRRSIALLMVLSASAQAWAGFGDVKTMRAPMPAHEVERSLIQPKGWVEVGFGLGHKVASGYWTPEGDVHEFAEGTSWTYDTWFVDLRYGLTNNTELWWRAPVLRARLVNETLGTDTKDQSIGDLTFGLRQKLFFAEAPLTSAAFELAYKGPAAQEAPGTYIGGPLNVSSFVFTTGTPDLKLGLAGKRQFGPLAITAHLAWNHRFSGPVQYLVDLTEYQFAGRIKPGDQVLADLGVMLQLGPVAISATPAYTHRAETRIGTTTKGLNPNANLDTVVGSDGGALDVHAQVMVNITRGMDVAVQASLPIMGEDLQFFPIEDLHPTFGPTIGGTIELRY